MSVSERQRLDLYERLGEALGREHAEVLMEYLPPVGWGDVARRHDVDLLRADLRTEMADLRGELRVELHREVNRMLVWLVGTVATAIAIVLAMIAYVS